MDSYVSRKPIGRAIDSIGLSALDVGARGGADADIISVAWATHMTCCEPEPAEAARLAQQGDARWRSYRVLPFAIGGSTGNRELHFTNDPSAASLLQHSPAMVERFGLPHLHLERERVSVSTVTLEELLHRGHISRTDFIKLDVEGAELEILQATGTLLGDCVAIKLEVSFLPQRIEQPLMWEVASFLDAAGFEIVDMRGFHRWRRRNLPAHPYQARFGMPYSRGQLAQCDIVALRASHRVREDVQGLRLIILAAALGYFDYAIGVLRQFTELNAKIKGEFGFNIESELMSWSAYVGRQETRAAIFSALRSLVPLSRSLIGRLPIAGVGPRY